MDIRSRNRWGERNKRKGEEKSSVVISVLRAPRAFLLVIAPAFGHFHPTIASFNFSLNAAGHWLCGMWPQSGIEVSVAFGMSDL